MVREKDGQRKRRRDVGKEDEALTEEQKQDQLLEDDSDNEVRSDQEEVIPPRPVVQHEIKVMKGAGNTDEGDAEEGPIVLDHDEELERELAAQFGRDLSLEDGSGGGKSSKKKQDSPEKKKKEEEDVIDSDEDEANRKKLEAVRAKREADKIAREKQQQEQDLTEQQKAAEKEANKDKPKQDYTLVLEAFKKVLTSGKNFSLNQLNQDANCKKHVKPALKKCQVKQLNKKALEDILKGQKEFVIEERDAMVYLARK